MISSTVVSHGFPGVHTSRKASSAIAGISASFTPNSEMVSGIPTALLNRFAQPIDLTTSRFSYIF